MRMSKDDVDVKLEIPGAVIRQRLNFGDATGLGKISGGVLQSLDRRRYHSSVPGTARQFMPVPALGLRFAGTADDDR